MPPRPLQLTSLIEDVPGVGPHFGRAFRALGLRNVGRLVDHLPLRHVQEEAEDAIEHLRPGSVVTARGEVTATRIAGGARYGRSTKGRFEAMLEDPTGRLQLVWFNQTFLHKRIEPGARLLVRGKATARNGLLQVANPTWEALEHASAKAGPPVQGARLRPVYPASEELPSRRIDIAITAALAAGALDQIDDHLPDTFCAARSMPPLRDAYRMLHAPVALADVTAAMRRIAYDELLLQQLAVHMRRAAVRRTIVAPQLRWDSSVEEELVRALPFALTAGQRDAICDVAADLRKPTPANRLLQGDVGAGKTVIALHAMRIAAACGKQSALLAPTELLAEQHTASLSRFLDNSGVRVELLTGSLTAADRAASLDRIASGESDIAVGTHALLSDGVRFKSLAVAVIDEQHRFGVAQRALLRDQTAAPNTAPHTFVMTATPIPRTLAMTLFGDLDVTTIADLPPGRTPVKTRLATPASAEHAYADVRDRIGCGQRAYIVVPAVEDGDLGLASVDSKLKELQHGLLSGARLAGLHGRMKRPDRDETMRRFRGGELDALVATTVIEVGVDVPEATAVVVEHAERFGLAQLHQLRGRVGRGSTPSVCWLVAHAATEEARQRLDAMVSTTSGFELAEHDLRIRGPGEALGARQSGALPFRVADLSRDGELLQLARRDAAAWIERSPLLGDAAEATLRRRVLKAHGDALPLADVG